MMVDENADNSGPKPKHDETAEDKSPKHNPKHEAAHPPTLTLTYLYLSDRNSMTSLEGLVDSSISDNKQRNLQVLYSIHFANLCFSFSI
ncbi:hypothetical protein ACE6H2_007341 [Prunus campanulata]